MIRNGLNLFCLEEFVMAVPKKRTSKQRQNKRQTHDNVGIRYRQIMEWTKSDKDKGEFFRGHNLPGMSRCPQCNHVRKPHRICGNCGHYDGEEVVEVE